MRSLALLASSLHYNNTACQPCLVGSVYVWHYTACTAMHMLAGVVGQNRALRAVGVQMVVKLCAHARAMNAFDIHFRICVTQQRS